MARQTAEQKIREMLTEVYAEGDVNAATIFKGYAHDTNQSGWHLKFFDRSDHIFMGTTVAEVSAYCDDVRSNREQDEQHYAAMPFN
jgi:hypothetical protein